MKQRTRPLRWRRLRAVRRATARRMVLAGAVVGLAAGVIAQPFTGGVHADIDTLARFALMLPGLMFVAWWLFMPTIGTDADEQATPDAVGLDVSERVERIESTFDSAAVPRPGRAMIEPADEATQRELHATVRRNPDAMAIDRRQFGLPLRAERGVEDSAGEQGATDSSLPPRSGTGG